MKSIKSYTTEELANIELVPKKLTRETDTPSVEELKAYKGSIFQSSNFSENEILDYLFSATMSVNDAMSNALVLIGGLEGISNIVEQENGEELEEGFLGTVARWQVETIIMDVAVKAMNFYEDFAEISVLDIDGQNENTSKSIQGKIWTDIREQFIPTLRGRINSTGVYDFVHNRVLPLVAKENYVRYKEVTDEAVKLTLAYEFNGSPIEATTQAEFNTIILGYIDSIVTGSINTALVSIQNEEEEMLENTGEASQQLRNIQGANKHKEHEERLDELDSDQAVQDNRLDGLESTQALHGERLDDIEVEQVTQNTQIATNTANNAAITEIIENQTTGEFVGATTGGTITEGVWTPINWTQTTNSFLDITYSGNTFTLTESITNLNFFIRGRSDNTITPKEVSIRLWDTVNNVVVGNIRTSEISSVGVVEYNSVIPTIASGSYRVEITATTGAGTVTFTQGEIYVFKFGGGGTGVYKTSGLIDDSATLPTTGFNVKVIKYDGYEQTLIDLGNNKADKTYVDTELENKVDKIETKTETINNTTAIFTIKDIEFGNEGKGKSFIIETDRNPTNTEYKQAARINFIPYDDGSVVINIQQRNTLTGEWGDYAPRFSTEIANKNYVDNTTRKLGFKLGLSKEELKEITGGDKNDKISN